MTTDLLTPSSFLPPNEVLHISQRAPQYISSQSSSISLPYPLSLLTNTESQEKWQTYENLFLACLRTGDDESAGLCLDQLTARFSKQNERVQALQGLYKEATATNDEELAEILEQYEALLEETPTNFPIRKRRIALLRSMGKTGAAITALTELLDVSPIDAEAWAELGDLYLTQGMYAQAIYSLEGVLLVTSNAWNIHARLGEALTLAASAGQDQGEQLKMLSEAMRRFCRSVELCDNYLRGYYGLKLTTTRLLEKLSKSSKPQTASSDAAGGDLAPPTLASVKRLNELATSKLAEILRRTSNKETGWDGYAENELIAARELLDRDTPSITR